MVCTNSRAASVRHERSDSVPTDPAGDKAPVAKGFRLEPGHAGLTLAGRSGAPLAGFSACETCLIPMSRGPEGGILGFLPMNGETQSELSIFNVHLTRLVVTAGCWCPSPETLVTRTARSYSRRARKVVFP